MNIKILDSWLREYVQTNATPQQIADKLSLTSVSIEHMEKYKNDLVYDVEITTNRPDLMSVIGLARETAAILPQFNIPAKFLSDKAPISNSLSLRERGRVRDQEHKNAPLTINNDPKLVNRICAVVMEVQIKDSPQIIKNRLESSDIRSLNNLIDITNYVMRVIGHPTHVMDYDRLDTKTIRIRESKKGEKVTTLDGKVHLLPGGDIVADNGEGKIIDLLGVMGVENSVVTDQTKRIVFFIDNNDQNRIRRTSMSTAIRTEAATINEKGIDPELTYEALLYGIKLYQELASGQILSDILDIYPNKPAEKTITVSEEKINQIIGVNIPLEKSKQILESLGFTLVGAPLVGALNIKIPSWRKKDIDIPEDIVEEIARVYGYHNVPNILPPVQNTQPTHIDQSDFYWEKRIKEAFKYWGFTETYTNSMISEDMFQGPIETAVAIQNPLTRDMSYMRNFLIPSLNIVVKENKNHDTIKIFEIGNIYQKTVGPDSIGEDLPKQILHLAALVKKEKVSFFEIKGLIEQLATDLGIPTLTFHPAKDTQTTQIYISLHTTPYSPLPTHHSLPTTPSEELLGEIQLIEDNTIAFELNLETLIKHATLKKIYSPLSKFPSINEDLSIVTSPDIATQEIIDTIMQQSTLIKQVTLLDRYEQTRTFHLIYQSNEKNLTTEEVGEIREKILKTLKTQFNATTK